MKALVIVQIIINMYSEKVIISPPQIEQPDIKAVGRKVIVELFDTLKPNTTYSIDFSDAIVDNNEGNPMGNFAFTFSTGEKIDSMEVSGTVLNAEDLEPIKGILVGLHSDVEDSAFVKKPIERVARTNGSGKFVIKGVAPGSYKVYALQDADQNFMFSQKSEKIAFQTELITTSSKPDIRLDTMWTDSIHYDTIVPVRYTHFYPDNIILRAFTEEQTNRYLVKSERLVPNRFSLFFSTKSDTLPIIRGLNFDEKDAFGIRISSVDGNPSLSGVENKCKKMFDDGCAPEDIALFCLRYVEKAIVAMLDYADNNLPVVFSGGVMSNSILQSALRAHCELLGRESYFATPEFSSDNAAGVAILASLV